MNIRAVVKNRMKLVSVNAVAGWNASKNARLWKGNGTVNRALMEKAGGLAAALKMPVSNSMEPKFTVIELLNSRGLVTNVALSSCTLNRLSGSVKTIRPPRAQPMLSGGTPNKS